MYHDENKINLKRQSILLHDHENGFAAIDPSTTNWYIIQVADQRLKADGLKAQEAAAETVENFEDEDDILGDGFVRLNIGDQTPKVLYHTTYGSYAISIVSQVIISSAFSKGVPTSRLYPER